MKIKLGSEDEDDSDSDSDLDSDSSDDQNVDSSDEDSSTSENSGNESKSKVISNKNIKMKNDYDEEDTDASDESDSEESSSNDSEPKNKMKESIPEKPKSATTSKSNREIQKEPKVASKSNLDLLLDFDDSKINLFIHLEYCCHMFIDSIFLVAPLTPIMTPSLGGFLTPIISNSSIMAVADGIKEVSSSFTPVKKYELLNKVSGRGLKMEYRFTRSQHLVSSTLVNIELIFYNESNEIMQNIRVGNKVCSKIASSNSNLVINWINF